MVSVPSGKALQPSLVKGDSSSALLHENSNNAASTIGVTGFELYTGIILFVAFMRSFNHSLYRLAVWYFVRRVAWWSL